MTNSKLWFPKFKKFVSKSVFGELQLTQIWLNFQTSYSNLNIRGLGAKLYVAFLLFFILEGIVTFSSQKSVCFLLNKNTDFNKNKTYEIKWKIPHTVLGRLTLRFSWYKNRGLKVKFLWATTPERKKRHFFYRLFCMKEIL